MRMTWEDIQQKHPEVWAILDNIERDGADIVSAELIGICNDDNVAEKKAAARRSGKKYWFVRTTTTPVPAYIHVANAVVDAGAI